MGPVACPAGRHARAPPGRGPRDRVADARAAAAAAPRRRAGPLDLALLAVRAALLGGLARAYTNRGAAFWLSPLADPAVAVRYTLSVFRPERRWRGRSYAA